MRLAVVVLVAAVLIGCTDDERPDRRPRRSDPVAEDPSPTASDPLRPSPASPSPTPTAAAGKPPEGGPVPDGFNAIDSTFIGPDVGWFLGTAPCEEPPCTSIVRTLDGGETWEGIPAPIAEIDLGDGCPAGGPCVSNIRFVDERSGWVFGPSLFETDDGGATWIEQDSDEVVALEAALGTVVRVTRSGRRDCRNLGACHAHVERSSVRGGVWEQLEIVPGGEIPGDGLEFTRSGDAMWLRWIELPQNTHVTYSGDGGDTWEVFEGAGCSWEAGYGFSAASETDVWKHCGSEGEPPPPYAFSRSRDGGRTYTTDGELPVDISPMAITYARGLLIHDGRVLLTVDGGRTWRETLDLPPLDPYPGIAGFVDDEHGRILDGDAVWFTEDGGETWDPSRFDGFADPGN